MAPHAAVDVRRPRVRFNLGGSPSSGEQEPGATHRNDTNPVPLPISFPGGPPKDGSPLAIRAATVGGAKLPCFKKSYSKKPLSKKPTLKSQASTRGSTGSTVHAYDSNEMAIADSDDNDEDKRDDDPEWESNDENEQLGGALVEPIEFKKLDCSQYHLPSRQSTLSLMFSGRAANPATPPNSLSSSSVSTGPSPNTSFEGSVWSIESKTATCPWCLACSDNGIVRSAPEPIAWAPMCDRHARQVMLMQEMSESCRVHMLYARQVSRHTLDAGNKRRHMNFQNTSWLIAVDNYHSQGW